MSNSNPYINFLHFRGINNTTIEDFSLGWCNELGRCSDPSFSSHIDGRFSNGVLFPFYDLYNNLIAVGSRNILEKNYIHSKYTKSKHLFGLNIAASHILKTGEVYIVEGNFDLLAMYQAGFKNTVALLGSKLSLTQIALLSRFANKFILVMDGDSPGQTGAVKISEVLKENGIEYEIVELPQGSDPDSFVKNKGGEALTELRQRSLLSRVKEIQV